MPLCESCTGFNISTLFSEAKTSNYYPIKESTLASLRQSSGTCELCSILLEIISFNNAVLANIDSSMVSYKLYLEDYGEILPQKSGENNPPEGIMGYDSNNKESVPRLAIHLQAGSQRRVVLPYGLQSKAPDSDSIQKSMLLHGRTVKQQMDIDLIQKWLKLCFKQHGTVCTPGDLHDDADGPGLRVIDVEDLCIVNLPDGARYVVLSYVWGGVEQLRLLRENYDEFTKPLGLRKHQGKLPKTIADAIDLAMRLGEKFLWVDALCIIQDDPADLAVQIQRMDVVYGCAALTIVAAAGSDADAGLPGLRLNSRRSLIIDQEIQGVRLTTALPSFADSIHRSTWETRGWTMQEKVLSKRLLVFTEHQIFFHCNCATWSEDAIWENQDPYIMLQPGVGKASPDLQRCSLPPRGVTGIRKYSHLVTGYHSRQLSYQSDALKAFSGALVALGKEMQTSFIWGLPESAFEESLLWRSPIQNSCLRREQFPSWTWLGWKASDLIGDILFPDSAEGHVEVLPLVQWHHVTSENHQRLFGRLMEAEYRELPSIDYSFSLEVSQHVLRFWTLTARLWVGREAQRSTTDWSEWDCYFYQIGIQEASGEVKEFGGIWLNKYWRESQPDTLEFIQICGRRIRNLYKEDEIYEGLELMLVGRKGNLLYRVQLIVHPIHEGWWWYARPEWKVVNLA